MMYQYHRIGRHVSMSTYKDFDWLWHRIQVTQLSKETNVFCVTHFPLENHEFIWIVLPDSHRIPTGTKIKWEKGNNRRGKGYAGSSGAPPTPFIALGHHCSEHFRNPSPHLQGCVSPSTSL